MNLRSEQEDSSPNWRGMNAILSREEVMCKFPEKRKSLAHSINLKENQFDWSIETKDSVE